MAEVMFSTYDKEVFLMTGITFMPIEHYFGNSSEHVAFFKLLFIYFTENKLHALIIWQPIHLLHCLILLVLKTNVKLFLG
jgi:hypothetical protein